MLWCGAAGAALVLASCRRDEPAPATGSVEEMRGEPINSPPPPAEADVTAEPAPAARKKKYPKPASFQKRMVEYYANRTNGVELAPMEPFASSPARVRFTREQLEAMQDPSIPADYEKVGFQQLAGFPFEVTRDMADGALDAAASSRATQSKIPEPVRALDGRLVAIRGFLIPLKMDEGLAVEFLLMRDQNLCCFGTVPKVNEWILVHATGRGVKPVMDQPITVMGRLQVGELRENGYLTGIYRIDAEKINGPGE